jgi:hypothetical protein
MIAAEDQKYDQQKGKDDFHGTHLNGNMGQNPENSIFMQS